MIMFTQQKPADESTSPMFTFDPFVLKLPAGHVYITKPAGRFICARNWQGKAELVRVPKASEDFGSTFRRESLNIHEKRNKK